MKKYLLLLTASLSLTVASAQTNIYQPFPTDSAAWLYKYQNSVTPNYSVSQWLGDTVINSTAYKKTYGKYSQNPNISGLQYQGGVRQDIVNEKLYVINLNNVESDASVSQHLQVGDTFAYFSPSPPKYIIGIDSILIDTKYHKRYLMRYLGDTGTTQQTDYRYIVGVGMEIDNGPAWSNELWCFYLKNTRVFGNPLIPYCPSTLTSINNEEETQKEISVYPNPFSTQTTLRTADRLENASLTIYNSFGQTVKRIDRITGQTIVFHRDNLPSGLYFVRLTQDGNTISADKFLITDK